MIARKPWSGFLSDERGVSAIEFAFITPAFIMLLGLVLVAGEGFAIQRKVNMAARTLVDLASRQTDFNTGTRSFNPTDILNAASLLMTPYESSSFSMSLTEVLIAPSTSFGHVMFSAGTGGATTYALGAGYYFPSSQVNLSANAKSYTFVGVVTYRFNPLGLFDMLPPITLSRTVYMSARSFGAY